LQHGERDLHGAALRCDGEASRQCGHLRAVLGLNLRHERPNTAVEVDLAPSLLESPEQIVRDFAGAQSKMEFPLNEGEHCLRCQFYKDLCPGR
jgi:hypothetical protein